MSINHLGNMKDWGKEGAHGIFETMSEYRQIITLNEELGLGELREMVNAKNKIPHCIAGNVFSLNHDLGCGTHADKIVKEYLDFGALLTLLEKDLWKDGRQWNAADADKFMSLAAGVMSPGAKMPSKMRETLQQLVDPVTVEWKSEDLPAVPRTPQAMEQMKRAIDNYKDGTPYKWNNVTFGAAWARHLEHGYFADEHDVTVAIAPQDKEKELKTVYPVEVCGVCGKKKKADGTGLSNCAGCNYRKYCGRKCQERHWRAHKIICTFPQEKKDALAKENPYGVMETFFAFKVESY